MKSIDIDKVENLNRNNDFIIRWNLTYLCNYKCDFCIQGNHILHINKSKGESIEKRKDILNHIISFIEKQLNGKYKEISLYLIGGEITFLSDFLEIVSSLINCEFDGLITIYITTNLSLSEERILKLTELFHRTSKQRRLYLNASYYKEFAQEEEFMHKVSLLVHKQKNSLGNKLTFIKKRFKRYLEPFISSKMLVKMNKITIHVGYPISSDNDYKDYLKFVKKYKSVTHNISYILIKDYKNHISEKLKKKLFDEKKQEKNIKVTFKDGTIYYCSNNNKISLSLEGEDVFYSKGYLCDVGLDNISISNLGVVCRCPSCKEQTVIGNIIKEELKLPTKKIVCPAEHCNCNYYKTIMKG